MMDVGLMVWYSVSDMLFGLCVRRYKKKSNEMFRVEGNWYLVWGWATMIHCEVSHR